jgi:hypothetical protein
MGTMAAGRLIFNIKAGSGPLLSDDRGLILLGRGRRRQGWGIETMPRMVGAHIQGELP